MICIPIGPKTQSEASEMIRKSTGLADVLELRMDLIAHGDLKELIDACRSASRTVKVLVTNRPGGLPREQERIAVLLEGISVGAEFVDIELETASLWREKVKTMISRHDDRTRLIVSYHNFLKTPSQKTLRAIFHECLEAGASVVKIVTLARSPKDNLSVLNLIPYAQRHKKDIIAFCMGKEGMISRIMAPLLGAYFTFASLARGAESAAGQLTVREMRSIYKILEKKG